MGTGGRSNLLTPRWEQLQRVHRNAFGELVRSGHPRAIDVYRVSGIFPDDPLIEPGLWMSKLRRFKRV